MNVLVCFGVGQGKFETKIVLENPEKIINPQDFQIIIENL